MLGGGFFLRVFFFCLSDRTPRAAGLNALCLIAKNDEKKITTIIATPMVITARIPRRDGHDTEIECSETVLRQKNMDTPPSINQLRA